MPGSDVIFSNSLVSPAYLGFHPGETWISAGIVPSPTHPGFAAFRPGCASQYTITGVEIAYCTDQSTLDVEMDFYDQFIVCGSVHTEPVVTTLTFNGLPGSSQAGVAACWIVTIDLRGAPGSSQAFTLQADGNGIYEPPTLAGDRFAWGFRIMNQTGISTYSILAGGIENPLGTRWSAPVVDYGALNGSGRGTCCDVEVQPQGQCVDMFGYAGGLYLRLFADACGDPTGEPFCTGDGSSTPCPCGNSSPAPNREGCRNSTNGTNGGRFEATGAASLSSDALVLKVLRLPGTSPVLFFQGTVQQAGGAGTVFGDGLRCAGGMTARIGTKTAVAGEASYPSGSDAPVSIRGGVTAPGVRDYQAWYRNNATFCTAAAFNLTNGWELTWQP